jgi:hypothetical protein
MVSGVDDSVAVMSLLSKEALSRCVEKVSKTLRRIKPKRAVGKSASPVLSGFGTY